MTLARDIAEALGVPVEETYGYLKIEDFTNYLNNSSSKQQEKVAEILAMYQDKLVALFKETGDSLTVPKKIYLHSNLNTESFSMTRSRKLPINLQNSLTRPTMSPVNF